MDARPLRRFSAQFGVDKDAQRLLQVWESSTNYDGRPPAAFLFVRDVAGSKLWNSGQ